MLERPNVFEVDLDAIAFNVAALRQRIGSDVELLAALKANAYGFGIERVSETVLSAGANGLAMVDVEHAVSLRRRGIEAPMLLYGGTPLSADVVRAVEDYRLWPTLLDEEDARRVAEQGQRTRERVPEVRRRHGTHGLRAGA